MKNLLKSIASKARALWADEPVLVSTVVPVLTTAGVLTAAQGSAVTSVLSGVVSVVAVVGTALKVRSKVSPVKSGVG